MIDIQTALTMIALCHLACGTSMALIWFRNRRTRGIADWTISRLFLVIAYTLYASQLSFKLSIFSAVILSNAFLFISFYLMWRGYAKFMLVQPRYAFVIFILLFISSMAGLAYYSYIDNSYPTRVVISSSMAVFWAISCILILRGKSKKRDYFAAKALSLPYVLLLAFHIVRVGYYSQGNSNNSFLHAGTVTGVTIVCDIILLMFIAIATIALIVEELHNDLCYDAKHDALTNIFNRRAFFTEAEALITRARQEQSPVTILMIDLDLFKRLNDRFGHLTGDHALVNFTKIVASSLTNNDLFARFGGEEFIILQLGRNQKDASHIAEEIRAKIQASQLAHELNTGDVTCSIGSASVEKVGSDFYLSRLISQADRSLYQAKSAGRNQVYCS